MAHCQLRFVVGTDWQGVGDAVRAHLDRHGFHAVQVKVTGACPATRLDLDNHWVDWAVASLQASSGKEVALLPNLAGSLPNEVFAEVLGLPTMKWVKRDEVDSVARTGVITGRSAGVQGSGAPVQGTAEGQRDPETGQCECSAASTPCRF